MCPLGISTADTDNSITIIHCIGISDQLQVALTNNWSILNGHKIHCRFLSLFECEYILFNSTLIWSDTYMDASFWGQIEGNSIEYYRSYIGCCNYNASSIGRFLGSHWCVMCKMAAIPLPEDVISASWMTSFPLPTRRKLRKPKWPHPRWRKCRRLAPPPQRGMGCLLWFWSLICIVLLSSQCRM